MRRNWPGESLPSSARRSKMECRIGGLTHAFPLPGQFRLRALTGIGMTGARAAAIAGIAACGQRRSAPLRSPAQSRRGRHAACAASPACGRGGRPNTSPCVHWARPTRALRTTSPFSGDSIQLLERPSRNSGCTRNVGDPGAPYAMLHLWMAGSRHRKNVIDQGDLQCTYGLNI